MNTSSSGESSAPITDRRQLVEVFARAGQPRDQWRIGVENEKFAYHLSDLRPVAYEGPTGIRTLLETLQSRFGGQLIYEDSHPIALVNETGSITLEPGGQLEFSGRPTSGVHDVDRELHEYLRRVKQVGEQLGIGFAGVGFQPKWSLGDIPWMPKRRYSIMKRYMPTRGPDGLQMMLASCSTQVNLDYSDETDMVQKLRVGLALQPIFTAVFANSPFAHGRPNGFQSYRAHVWWEGTDPDRCGDIPCVFEPGFGFERYVEYALDVPMYLVRRGEHHHDAAGLSFRDFLNGRLAPLPGERPTLNDWSDHLTTLFPDARLKPHIELRGADVGSPAMILAMAALSVGLLYDQSAIADAWQLVCDWNAQERQDLRHRVSRQGLTAEFRGRPVNDIAREMVDIAHRGLTGRHQAGHSDERPYLEPLQEITATARSPATSLLDLYHNKWNSTIDPIFAHCRY